MKLAHSGVCLRDGSRCMMVPHDPTITATAAMFEDAVDPIIDAEAPSMAHEKVLRNEAEMLCFSKLIIQIQFAT